ncbi:MAG: isoprenyl transferase [Chitinophagaceae bacterium]|nr:isoprenyl transferase [Chitinophagaceae bacterium]
MKNTLNYHNVPKHIAIIMDGNGRWAKKQGAKRIFGHQNAITAVRETTECCTELGVKYLTLYAFSTENWQRPADEVQALMTLLVSTIKKELSTLQKNNIKLLSIGDETLLPKNTQAELRSARESTQNNTGLSLILALNYSGRLEIVKAVKDLVQYIAQEKNTPFDLQKINESFFESFLFTKGIPDPELLIRTSGEQRISNFLLWQIAYTEIYITDVLWPDFRKEHLIEAIVDFQKRERRFGKTSEQIQ